MKHPFQELRTSNHPYNKELKEVATKVIDSGWYLLGEETRNFEKELSVITATQSAVGVGTGLDAIRLIFRAYIEIGKLKRGDTVVAPSHTFIASVLPLTELGLNVKLAPPSLSTYNLDFNRLSEHLTSDVKALLLVHLYGSPCWDREIINEAREKGIIIVEDNAQALGASIIENGIVRPTGGLGDASAVSFYPGKNIGALGDAGAVCSSNMQLIETVRQLANYGGDKKYYYKYLGYNSRIDEIQAAFLRVKLRHINEVNEQRRKIAFTYRQCIKNPLITLPHEEAGTNHVWHQYVIRTPQRNRLQQYLTEKEVGTMIHYPVAIDRQECYDKIITHKCPIAYQLSNEVLSIPIANVSPEEAIEISEIINSFK